MPTLTQKRSQSGPELWFFSSRTEFSPAHLPHKGLILSGYKNILHKSRILLNMKHNPIQTQIPGSMLSPTDQKLPREVLGCPSLETFKTTLDVVICRFFSNLGRSKACKIINITKPHGIERENCGRRVVLLIQNKPSSTP